MGGGVKRLGSLKGIKIGQLAIPGFPFGGYRPDPRRKKQGSLLSSILFIRFTNLTKRIMRQPIVRHLFYLSRQQRICRSENPLFTPIVFLLTAKERIGTANSRAADSNNGYCDSSWTDLSWGNDIDPHSSICSCVSIYDAIDHLDIAAEK